MNERQEGPGKFVLARGDASVLLDVTEEAFDQLAIFVEMPMEQTREEPVGTPRNHGLTALTHDPKTVSTNRRLPRAMQPGSLDLPGSRGSMRSRW
jgi:hypothetical protein